MQVFWERHGRGAFDMQEVNSTYSTDGCQSTLSGEGLTQDAVCDVPPYSFTAAIKYAGRHFERLALVL